MCPLPAKPVGGRGAGRNRERGPRRVALWRHTMLETVDLKKSLSKAAYAKRMLETLSGATHEVVSGLFLRTPQWEELHCETTRVTFRRLTPRDLEHYLASGEWKGRAGGGPGRHRERGARTATRLPRAKPRGWRRTMLETVDLKKSL